MTNSKADLGERKRDGPIERSHTASSSENPQQSPQINTLPPVRDSGCRGDQGEGVSSGAAGSPKLIKRVGGGCQARG